MNLLGPWLGRVPQRRIVVAVGGLGFAAVLAALFGWADPAFAAPKRLVFKEATVVEGQVQKPEVAVFISRQNLNKGYELELKESFLPKILETVQHEPF
jgi:hypothetical protein